MTQQSYRGIDYRTLRGPHTEATRGCGPRGLLWHAVYEVNGKGHFVLNRRSQKDLMFRLERAIDEALLPKPKRYRPPSKRQQLIEKLNRMTVANGCTVMEAAAATAKLCQIRR